MSLCCSKHFIRTCYQEHVTIDNQPYIESHQFQHRSQSGSCVIALNDIVPEHTGIARIAFAYAGGLFLEFCLIDRSTRFTESLFQPFDEIHASDILHVIGKS